MSRSPEELLKHRKRQAYLVAIGRPTMVTGPERAQALARLRAFRARGMAFVQMAEQVDCPARTIAGVLDDRHGSIKRPTLDMLNSIRFEEPAPHIRVSSLGTRRRMGGLWVAGYPIPLLTEMLGIGNRGYWQKVIKGKKAGELVSAATRLSVERLTEKLEHASPTDFGVDLRKAAYCTTWAKKSGCVPLTCWDPDTIDDPEAYPEWTGQCGSQAGYRIHRRENIPVCRLCRDADDLAYASRPPLSAFSPEKFKALRERHGLSQRKIALLAGVDSTTIIHWESGRSKPSRQGKIDTVLSALGARFEDVCDDQEK